MTKRKLFTTLKKHSKSREALIVTGMRQVGKTTLLRQLYDDLGSGNKVFFDLEKPLLQKIFENDNYDQIVLSLRDYDIHIKERAYVFLDEIQFVKRIPSFVKYTIDHYGWKFFLTGSSSFYLKNLFSEFLAGRKFLFELYPCDFKEFLTLRSISQAPPSLQESITRTQYERWQPLYEEFVKWGGFPAVVTRESIQEKKMILDDIFTSYFNKEVLLIGDFRNNRSMRDLILLLLQRVGSKLDMQKLASELNISRATVKEYISFLEGTYFISLVPPFTQNRDVEIRSTPKIYACDSGIANVFGNVGFGHVFENAIYHQLRIRGGIYYYQKKSGAEVDFILDKKHGFEAKIHGTRTEVNRLNTLSKELRLKKRNLISFTYTTSTEIAYGFQL